MLIVAALILIAAAIGAQAADNDPVVVDLGAVIAPVEPRTIGINVNYLLDDDRNRPQARPLVEALREMGVRSLRYPGGGKSQSYLWSVPPFDRARPTLARVGKGEWPSQDRTLVADDYETFRTHPLDFDAFIAIATELRAEPVCVICFDAMYNPALPGGRAPTREQLLDTAVAWVRYSAGKGFHVRRWENNNESYMDHHSGSALAADYPRDLVVFAAAMKAADPSISIIANGPNEAGAV